MGKTYWMFVTNETNFEISREQGFKFQGVESTQRRKASRLSPEDRIIYYLTDRRAFAATATITSEPFEDDSPVWRHYKDGELFPHRVETRPDIVLDDDQMVDALEVGPRLEYVRKWAPEDWPLAFVGPLHIIPQRDFSFLEDEMKRAQSVRSRGRNGRRRKGRRGGGGNGRSGDGGTTQCVEGEDDARESAPLAAE